MITMIRNRTRRKMKKIAIIIAVFVLPVLIFAADSTMKIYKLGQEPKVELKKDRLFRKNIGAMPFFVDVHSYMDKTVLNALSSGGASSGVIRSRIRIKIVNTQNKSFKDLTIKVEYHLLDYKLGKIKTRTPPKLLKTETSQIDVPAKARMVIDTAGYESDFIIDNRKQFFGYEIAGYTVSLFAGNKLIATLTTVKNL
jgi:hypothetical protein